MSSDGTADSSLNGLSASPRDVILEAMVQVVCERGYSGASLALVTARAGVSRRTFYRQFAGLEECFAAVLDLGLTLPSALIAQAFAREEDWREGVRAALVALLSFFDAEPGLTRCWFAEALAAGGWALEHRERNIAAVQAVIVGRWIPAGSRRRDSVLVRGGMASVLGVLTTHVVTRDPQPLITLLAPLTSLIMTPLLGGQEVERELERAEQLTRELLIEGYPPPSPRPSGRSHAGRPALGAQGGGPPAVKIPPLLSNRKAIRARLCLRYLAEQGEQGSNPTNRQIATAIGVSTKGQMSKLLARLESEQLMVKKTHGTAWPNAWELTEYGRAVAGYFEHRESSKQP